MAFLFLPELPDSIWEFTKSIPKAEPSVSLRGTSIQPQSFARIFSRPHYQWLQFTPMLPPSHNIVTSSMTKWISSLPDSLANLSPKPLLDDEKESKTNGGCGLPSSTSFARHHPPSSSWRTSQTSLTNMKHFLKYSQPWPRSGSMLNGSLYKQAKSERIIKEIVYSSSPTDLNISTFYPTPTASDIIGGVRKPDPNRNMAQKLRDEILQPLLFPTPTTANNMLSPSFLPKSHSHRNLRAFLPTPTHSDGTRGSTSYGPGNLTLKGAPIHLSTPTTNDATNQTFPKSQLKRNSLIAKIMQQTDLNGGKDKPRLSPLFVEWMMGFHTGWTDLEHSETQ